MVSPNSELTLFPGQGRHESLLSPTENVPPGHSVCWRMCVHCVFVHIHVFLVCENQRVGIIKTHRHKNLLSCNMCIVSCNREATSAPFDAYYNLPEHDASPSTRVSSKPG